MQKNCNAHKIKTRMQNIKPPCNSYTPHIRSLIQEQAVHNKCTFYYRRCSTLTHPEAPTSDRHLGLPTPQNAAALTARPAQSCSCLKEQSTHPKAAQGQTELPAGRPAAPAPRAYNPLGKGQAGARKAAGRPEAR